MKRLVVVFILITILTASVFTLTGCSFTISTDENSVSASVDDDTKNTFDNIVDWVVERLHRIFSGSSSGGSSTTIQEQTEKSKEKIREVKEQLYDEGVA